MTQGNDRAPAVDFMRSVFGEIIKLMDANLPILKGERKREEGRKRGGEGERRIGGAGEKGREAERLTDILL